MSDIFLYVSSCIQWNIIKNMIKKKENKGKRKKGRKGHTAVDTEDSVFRLCRRECRDSTVDGAVFPKIQMGQLFVSTVYVEALFFL